MSILESRPHDRRSASGRKRCGRGDRCGVRGAECRARDPKEKTGRLIRSVSRNRVVPCSKDSRPGHRKDRGLGYGNPYLAQEYRCCENYLCTFSNASSQKSARRKPSLEKYQFAGASRSRSQTSLSAVSASIVRPSPPMETQTMFSRHLPCIAMLFFDGQHMSVCFLQWNVKRATKPDKTRKWTSKLPLEAFTSAMMPMSMTPDCRYIRVLGQQRRALEAMKRVRT